ncbi:hypothetical protein GCM10009583_20070 [Ornithinicoccus hortensis]
MTWSASKSGWLAAANDGARAPQVTSRDAPDQAGWFFNEFKPSVRPGRRQSCTEAADDRIG